MSLDIHTISLICDELGKTIIGMRVDKVTQPARDIIILNLRGKTADTKKLLFCADIANSRVHLTEYIFDNPPAPPMFCMLLRKYLTGAKIEKVNQPTQDRIIEISFKTSSALGDTTYIKLTTELFGRIPNIILTDKDGIIIDCLRRIGGNTGTERMILPGLRYRMPERSIQSYKKDNTHIESVTQTVSEYLDNKYTIKSKDDSMRQRGAMMIKTMKTAHKRISRKLSAQKAELAQTENRDYIRETADIIMANLHRINKGDTLLIADDFYVNSGKKREIPLDPLKTPQKNAAAYYKKYTKARNAVEHLTKQIAEGERELEYVDSVLEQLTRTENEQELEEIREELVQTKYIKNNTTGKNKTSGKRKMKIAQSKPREFKLSGAMTAYVGKNNTQNDRLTFKTAAKTDIWLHAQKIHGAHVIIKTDGKTPNEKALEEAAGIAAYYSAARGSGKIAVDYTLVKNVKKTPGAKPGMVIYTDFKTIIADSNFNIAYK